MKVLHIFDFDDTLIHSDSSVIINHADGNKSILSSDEYATYDELPDDEIDFSEFDRYPTNAELIETVFMELKSAISKDGLGSVVVLTARGNPTPVSQFLSDNGVPGIEVHAVGSSNPMDKAKYVLSRVLDEEIDLVRVFEDNARNIREIRKVLRATGNIGLQTHRIVDGNIARVRNIRPTKT